MERLSHASENPFSGTHFPLKSQKSPKNHGPPHCRSAPALPRLDPNRIRWYRRRLARTDAATVSYDACRPSSPHLIALPPTASDPSGTSPWLLPPCIHDHPRLLAGGRPRLRSSNESFQLSW